jgi:hypothetical protein
MVLEMCAAPRNVVDASNHVNIGGVGVGSSAAVTAMGVGLGIALLPVPSSTFLQ